MKVLLFSSLSFLIYNMVSHVPHRDAVVNNAYP